MTRVTDEDLEWLAGYCDGDSSKAARVARDVRAELLALRKAADAARRYIDVDHDVDRLLEALEGAGR